MYAGIEMVNAPMLNTTATAAKNRRITAYPPNVSICLRIAIHFFSGELMLATEMRPA